MKSTAPILIIILGIGVGLLLTVQWKTPPQRVVNPISPYLALRDTRKSLADEQSRFKTQISQLQKSIDQETIKTKNDDASRALADEASKMKAKVGLTEVTSSGISINLDDASSGKGTTDNITHAADLRDIVNVLWKNGAQAISINGERVVLNTSIDCIVNTILINNTHKTPPFKILASGDSFRLETVIKDKNNLGDLWKREETEGLILDIKREWRITIPAFNGSYKVNYASKE